MSKKEKETEELKDAAVDVTEEANEEANEEKNINKIHLFHSFTVLFRNAS